MGFFDSWNPVPSLRLKTPDFNHPFRSLADAADPLGTHPVDRAMHEWVASWADPQETENGGFAGMIAKPGAAHGPPSGEPSQEAGAMAGVRDQQDRVGRARSASSILSPTGAGLMDEPYVYSAARSLLGD